MAFSLDEWYIYIYKRECTLGEWKKEQTPRRKTTSRRDSRNNASPGPSLPSTSRLLRVAMRPRTHWTLSKSLKNIFISNAWSFFQVLKDSSPLKFAIVNQGVPHNLMCFLHMPLRSIKDQIAMLTMHNPRESTPQEKNQIQLNNFNVLLLGRSKRHCFIEKETYEDQGYLFWRRIAKWY